MKSKTVPSGRISEGPVISGRYVRDRKIGLENCSCGIPFNVARSHYFQDMMSANGSVISTTRNGKCVRGF